jgi:hypothetical protein
MDFTAPAMYWETFARCKEANDYVSNYGTVVKAPSGYLTQSHTWPFAMEETILPLSCRRRAAGFNLPKCPPGRQRAVCERQLANLSGRSRKRSSDDFVRTQ